MIMAITVASPINNSPIPRLLKQGFAESHLVIESLNGTAFHIKKCPDSMHSPVYDWRKHLAQPSVGQGPVRTTILLAPATILSPSPRFAIPMPSLVWILTCCNHKEDTAEPNVEGVEC